MNTRRLLLLSALCLFLGAAEAPAQGILNRIKKKGTELIKNAVTKPVRDAVNAADDATRPSTTPQRRGGSTGQRALNPSTKTVSVKLCEGVGQKMWYGRTGGITPQPPAECPKQPQWSEALPLTWHLDNARLVAESVMLEKWLKDGKPSCEPVLVRREAVDNELGKRTRAVEKAVKYIIDADPEEAEFMAQALEDAMFKHAVGSDLAPLYPYLDDNVVKWLKGVDRATKTIDVQVSAGGSSDPNIVQQGEMWFRVNPSRQTATLECLDMDQSVGKDYTVPATITYSGRTFKVTAIGETAFADLKVRSVTLSPGLTTIGRQAFTRTRITSIDIPSTVTSIDYRAFAENPALQTVTVPSSVRKLGLGIFAMCTGLTTAKLPDAVDSMGNTMFFGCTALTSVTLPGNITAVPESTFEDCKALARVTLPATVAVIEQNAFKHTALTAVPVPAALTKIESCAFEGCSRLTSASVPASVEVDDMAFKGCKSLKK